jgi:outer membrane protein OmpA-like peptidoglycan-associated protein
MRYLFLFIFFSLLSFALAVAQKEANIWYFGKKAGVDFSTGQPVALTDGALETEEGCVTIADKQGKLLFYTDGITVRNRNHQAMPNGKDLKGHPSSTQSGVVIRKPKSPNLYYLFTVIDIGREEGLRYSIIDITLQNGLGDIATTKDVQIKASVTEKLTAVKHRNGVDMWVLVHEWNSDKFLAYLVTERGISTTPIESVVGTAHKGNSVNSQGYMKLSPDGTGLALAIEDDNLVELFDFNNETGTVSIPITFKLDTGSFPYGIEFSPNGSLLYVSAAGTGKIFQYNLQAGSEAKIQVSKTEVGSSPNREWIGALQIAPDGKIYFPIYNKPFLGVIERPNEIGLKCGYKNNAVGLEGRNAQLGLPTFAQSFFEEIINNQPVIYFDPHKVEIGKTVVLRNVLFEYAKYDLKPVSYAELQKVAVSLKNNPILKIKLLGHTDNIGNKSANITLSDNRCKAVKTYLVSQGIAEDRITFEGFGSSQPITTNATAEGRQRNRRVEMIAEK